MLIKEREPGDVKRLRELARREKRAEEKDRLMVPVLAIEGRETGDIMKSLCRSRGFVQRWAYAYRDGGIDAVRDEPRAGSEAKISDEKALKLKARLDAGPTEADGVCTLRGRDIQRIAREELGTKVGLSSVYRTLERPGYSCLAPRPRHELQDLAAQQKSKDHSTSLCEGTLRCTRAVPAIAPTLERPRCAQDTPPSQIYSCEWPHPRARLALG